MIYIADHQTDDILSYIPEEDFWDDNHHKSLLDNQETFDFVTFADKPYSQHLEKMNRIIIQDEDGDWVELYIRNTRKDHDGDAVFTEVYTSATYVRLKTAKQMAPHRTEALSAEAHATRALNGTEWTIGIIDFKGVRTFTFEDYVNPYDYLRRIASEFNLELRFKVETNGNKITRRYVDIVEYVGSWNGKVVEFGKDLIGIERKEDFSNVVTALIGLGPEDEEGNRLEVFVEDLDALQRWGRNGQHIIGIYEPESTDASMSMSRLRDLTENELEKRINSQIQYMAEVVDLENVTGLDHERFRFGSFIRIKDLKFNPPLYLEARVHTQNRPIKKRSRPKRVVLGDYIEYSEEDVNAIVKDLRKQLRNKIGIGDLEELTYTKPEVDQKVSDVVDDAQQAAVEVVDSIEIGGRNIASNNSILKSSVIEENYVYSFVKDGTTNPNIRVPTSNFEENKRYVISFKVKKISGNVTSLAGHDQSFRGMPVEIYRDGVRIEDVTTWSVGDQNYPNDNEVHEYEIHIRTPETFPSDDSAPYWYIQPNRPNYGENYELELWDFQIEQATKKSNWERPQDDVEEDIQQAKEDSEEAKLVAQNAMSTADGKNTVYRQSSTPPTTNRKIGDLWFKTNEGNKMYVWTGEWTETKLDYQALAVGKLSAISADLGNVTAGDVSGVNISGSKFESTGEEGNIKIENDTVESWLGNLFALLKSGELVVGRDTGGGTIDEQLTVARNSVYYTGQSGWYWGVEHDNGDMNLTSSGVVKVDGNEISAIETQGTNANGTYVRYSNGMQICFHRMASTSNVSGLIAYIWTLPASFVNNAYFTTANLESTSYLSYGMTLQKTTTSATLRASGVNPNLEYHGVLFAIGRWK